MPPPNSLAVLYLQPVNTRSNFYACDRYETGRFQYDSGGRKLWWHSSRGVNDPVRMRKHYDIWWCPVPEFDGI